MVVRHPIAEQLREETRRGIITEEEMKQMQEKMFATIGVFPVRRLPIRRLPIRRLNKNCPRPYRPYGPKRCMQKGSLHQENKGNVRSRFPHSG